MPLTNYKKTISVLVQAWQRWLYPWFPEVLFSLSLVHGMDRVDGLVGL